MRIRAALVGPSRPWEELLTQEGFPWDVVDAGGMPLDEYSVAIIHRRLDRNERESVEQFLRKGGGVIGDIHLAGLAPAAPRDEYIDYLTGDGRFRRLHLLDLGAAGSIPREAEDCRTQQGAHAVFAGELGGGLAVILPFSPAAAMADERSAQRAFYSTSDRLPSERVSLTAKGELHHLIHDALEFLHVERGIPYLHLWYFPDGCENVFGFRVDTDGASPEELADLYRVARAHGTRMTWFLDLHSDQFRLDQYLAMEGQELGIHCFEHREPAEGRSLREDLQKGLGMLSRAGIRPEGYAATYGFWKPFVSGIARELGLRYTSEFSCGYDTHPFVPVGMSTAHGPLQVPIHPVCPGTLRQAGYTQRAMGEYYRRVIAVKRGRREPLIFYHHPSHSAWDVVGELCREGEATGTRQLTFGEYAGWWEKRGMASPDFTSVGGGVECGVEGTRRCADAGVHLRIARPGGEECILPPAERIGLEHLPWREIPFVPPPPDLRRIREFDLRRGLGSLVNSMMRRIR